MASEVGERIHILIGEPLIELRSGMGRIMDFGEFGDGDLRIDLRGLQKTEL